MESIIIYTLLAIVLICVCYFFNRELKYEKLKYLTNKQKELDSNYFNETKNFKTDIINDTGAPLEYYIFQTLDKNENYHKIIANCYLKDQKQNTCEIDIIFITTTGLYVIESKNFHGLIYGNQQYRYWTQFFNKNSKYHFFNPIWQNKKHLECLNLLLNQFLTTNHRLSSYIVFSNHCTLKEIRHTEQNCIIMQLKDLETIINVDIINSPIIYTKQQIDDIYQQLKKYSCVSKTEKINHITRLEKNHS